MSLSLIPRESPSPLGPSKANQACSACKRQKRKCDKFFPACGLCARMGRPCDYSDGQASVPTAEDFAALQMKLAGLENRLNTEGSQPAMSEYASAAAEAAAPSATAMTDPPDAATSLANGSVTEAYWSPAPNRLPSVLFLDIDAFKSAGVALPKLPLDIPLEVLQILNDGDGVQQAANDYFANIHPWFPIISKKRMNLGIPLWDGGPDLAMLFLAMKLITWRPVSCLSPAETPIYQAAKRLLSLLESAGSLSLLNLQAMMLVALYEYGHCIYPAAWMTVGACARYGEILGLQAHGDTCTVLGPITTWTEAEERRRAWWGIYILDRVVSLGNKKRFAAGNPGELGALPADDDAWDNGNMAGAFQRSVKDPITEPVSPFGRLCQACMLISRAQEHCSAARQRTRSGDKLPMDLADVEVVLGALDEMLRVLDDEVASAVVNNTNTPSAPKNGSTTGADTPSAATRYMALVAPRCLVWSAIMLVLDLYSCPESLRDGAGSNLDGAVAKSPALRAMQVRAIDGLTRVADRVRGFARELVALASASTPSSPMSFATPPSNGPGVSDSGSAGAGLMDRIPALGMDAVYCAMATYHWLWRESGDETIEVSLRDVKLSLGALAGRWVLATCYLEIEHHHDISMMMAVRAELTGSRR